MALVPAEGDNPVPPSSPPLISAVAGDPPLPKVHDNDWVGVEIRGGDLQIGQNTRYRQGHRQTDASFLYPESENHRRTTPSVSRSLS